MQLWNYRKKIDHYLQKLKLNANTLFLNMLITENVKHFFKCVKEII